jgi:hypothetical protein
MAKEEQMKVTRVNLPKMREIRAGLFRSLEDMLRAHYGGDIPDGEGAIAATLAALMHVAVAHGIDWSVAETEGRAKFEAEVKAALEVLEETKG